MVNQCPNDGTITSANRCPKCGYVFPPVKHDRTAQPTPQRRTTRVKCPECGNTSDSIKCYEMLNYCIFIWVYVWWQGQTVCMCSSCMRRYILKKALISIPTMNILCPIYLLYLFALFIGTFTQGHSKKVYEMIS